MRLIKLQVFINPIRDIYMFDISMFKSTRRTKAFLKIQKGFFRLRTFQACLEKHETEKPSEARPLFFLLGLPLPGPPALAGSPVLQHIAPN